MSDPLHIGGGLKFLFKGTKKLFSALKLPSHSRKNINSVTLDSTNKVESLKVKVKGVETELGRDAGGAQFVAVSTARKFGDDINGLELRPGIVAREIIKNNIPEVKFEPTVQVSGQFSTSVPKLPFEIQATGIAAYRPRMKEGILGSAGLEAVGTVGLVDPVTGSSPIRVAADENGINYIEGFLQPKPLPVIANPRKTIDLEVQPYTGARYSNPKTGITQTFGLQFMGMLGPKLSFEGSVDTAVGVAGIKPSFKAEAAYRITNKTAFVGEYQIGDYVRKPTDMFSSGIGPKMREGLSFSLRKRW
jgi:hypothetical protein